MPSPALLTETSVMTSASPPPAVQNSILSAQFACEADPAAQLADRWQALADNPLERNVFYEPWMLLPAMQAFGQERDLRVLFVFRNGSKTEVAGVFPLQYHRFKFLPLTVISLWRHPHCFLCTPLLNREDGAQVLSFALDKLLDEHHGRALIAFRTISGDGPFHSMLMEELSRRQLLSLSEVHSRPIARPTPASEEFLRTEISGKRRRAILRRERKLASLGELEYQTEVDDWERWTESFLQMESAGWKGREGTALNAVEESRRFFRTIVAEAYRRGRAMPISLLLNGKPVAHRLSFVSGDEAFAFKSTYDERYSTYSPGVLLELETLRDLHIGTDLRMMDSCTAEPEHSPMNGMWREQRAIHTVFVMPDTTVGRLVRSTLPALRRLQQKNSPVLNRR